MNRTFLPLAVTLGALALTALPAHRAGADDETDELEIKVQAPLDAAACVGVPPTVTVLGLAIDVGAAAFQNDGAGSCAALVVGQPVEVKLASDAAPLVATEMGQQGEEQGLQIKAPVQAIDPTAQTITVLGLVVDVSGASLAGADDGDTTGEGGDQPIDASQLMVGQYVQVQLDAAKLPALVATQLEVKNFDNQVDVEVDEPDGSNVNDIDENGDPVDDVDVDVTETVRVHNAAPGAVGKVKKVLHFEIAAHGRFSLRGLPTGKIKVSARRVKDGVTMTRSKKARVKGNTTRTLRLRLLPRAR